MVNGLISALEGYYQSPINQMKELSLQIATQLIIDNTQQFIIEDKLSTVWNIYFVLESNLSQANRIIGHSICLIDSLLYLNPIYISSSNQSLVYQILYTLLSIKNPSNREIKIIQQYILSYFNIIVENKTNDQSLFLQVLLSLITNQNQECILLLSWCLYEYINIVILQYKNNKNTIYNVDYNDLFSPILTIEKEEYTMNEFPSELSNLVSSLLKIQNTHSPITQNTIVHLIRVLLCIFNKSLLSQYPEIIIDLISNIFISPYQTRSLSLQCILSIGNIYQNKDIIDLSNSIIVGNSVYNYNNFHLLSTYLFKLFNVKVSTMNIRKLLNNINFCKEVYIFLIYFLYRI